MVTVNEYAMYILDKLPGNDTGYSWEFFKTESYDKSVDAFIIQHGDAVLEINGIAPVPLEYVELFGDKSRDISVRFIIGEDEKTLRLHAIDRATVQECDYLIQRLIDMTNAFNPA